MKILDTTNGNIHEYGSNQHDSLEISSDGRTLTYYNLQCGDGSQFGTYRFVMEDGKIPAESQTEDARYSECYFNIGGFDKRPHGEWGKYVRPINYITRTCLECGNNSAVGNFCMWCGADMRQEEGEAK